MVLANWAVSCSPSRNAFPPFPPSLLPLDPRWAIPIKSRVRDVCQVRAMNEVVNALKPEQQQMANGGDAPLRVVNGVRTFRSLWLRRWMYTSPPLKTFMVVPETSPLDAVAISPPTPSKSLKRNPALSLPSLRSPSLATLERACQKIFRKPPLHSASPIILSGATATGYGKGYARYGLARGPR